MTETNKTTVRRILSRVRWWELRTAPPSTGGAMVRASARCDCVYALQGDNELVAYIAAPKENATLILREA